MRTLTQEEILKLKRSVYDLGIIFQLEERIPEFVEASNKIRDILERELTNGKEIPLYWYEFSDEAFLRKIEYEAKFP